VGLDWEFFTRPDTVCQNITFTLSYRHWCLLVFLVLKELFRLEFAENVYKRIPNWPQVGTMSRTRVPKRLAPIQPPVQHPPPSTRNRRRRSQTVFESLLKSPRQFSFHSPSMCIGGPWRSNCRIRQVPTCGWKDQTRKQIALLRHELHYSFTLFQLLGSYLLLDSCGPQDCFATSRAYLCFHESECIQKFFLSVWSHIVACIISPLRTNQFARDLSSICVPFRYTTMAILSFKVEQFFILLAPFTYTASCDD
jgi:hypothetical protein